MAEFSAFRARVGLLISNFSDFGVAHIFFIGFFRQLEVPCCCSKESSGSSGELFEKECAVVENTDIRI